MRVLLLLLVACSSKPASAFYCNKDGACSLVCSQEPCTTRATATCAWLAEGSSYLCYAQPADCAEAAKTVRLRKCELKTPDEMLPR